MDTKQLIISAVVIFIAIFLLIKMVGLQFFGKALVVTGIVLAFFLEQQSELPRKNLNSFVYKCQQYQSARYSVYHIESRRRVYIFTKGNSTHILKDACLLADNGKTWLVHWYNMSLRNEVDFSREDALSQMTNAKNKMVVNGSRGKYEIFSPTTLPLFHTAITAYKDSEGTLLLKLGYTDDRMTFVSRF